LIRGRAERQRNGNYIQALPVRRMREALEDWGSTWRG
jgi:hypothetical protein